MTIEVALKEIKSLLSEVNSKLDSLLEEKDTCALMALEEKSLKDFLKGEPDIYTFSKASRQSNLEGTDSWRNRRSRLKTQERKKQQKLQNTHGLNQAFIC